MTKARAASFYELSMTAEQIFKAFAMIRATLPGVKKIAVDPATFGACMFAMRSIPMIVDIAMSGEHRPLTIYDIEVYKAPTDGSSGSVALEARGSYQKERTFAYIAIATGAKS